jgi:phage shock protein A
MRESEINAMQAVNERLRKLQAGARYEADRLLFGVIHYGKAQEALEEWRPELAKAEARLADLKGQHAELLAQWKEAKAEAEAKKREWQQARATKANNESELAHAATLSIRQAGELAQELTALEDRDIEPLGYQVAQLRRGVKTLEAVELPALPSALSEWLAGGD